MSVQTLALNQALKILVALKAQYKVILPDGEEFGELVVKGHRNKANKGKRAAKIEAEGRHWGEMAQYIKPQLEGVLPGEVVVIAKDKYDMETLASNVSNYAGIVWGRGTYKTLANETGVEVFRIS